MGVFIDVFALTVNDCFSLILLVVFEWIVRSKSVSVDGERLLLAVVEEESHGRFISGFRWDNVPLIAAAINECEYRWLILGLSSTTTFREPTRARRLVALATFQPRRNVDLVDFNRPCQVGHWRVERSSELLDAM